MEGLGLDQPSVADQLNQVGTFRQCNLGKKWAQENHFMGTFYLTCNCVNFNNHVFRSMRPLMQALCSCLGNLEPSMTNQLRVIFMPSKMRQSCE